MDQKRYTLSLFSTSPNPAHNKTVEKVLSVPWSDLPGLILSHNWSPAIFENQARLLTNCKGSPSLFAFDIDEGMTLDEAKRAFKNYQCIIATSRNHQKIKHLGQESEKPACDRFRVIFALSEPITTDSDFKATWQAYKDRYPLDPQTCSSSMFFFKSSEIIFNGEEGLPLAVVKAETWNEIKSDIYSFTKDDANPTRGMISKRSREFLERGAPSGLFNLSLFQCAVDHLEQKYTEEEFLEIGSKCSSSGAFSPFDSVDLATIKSAFNREPKYGKRVVGTSTLDAQKLEIATRIMDGEFIQCVQPQSTIWYQIKDYENQEVERIENEQIIKRYISQEIKKPENHYTGSKKVTVEGTSTFAPCTKKMSVEEVIELWELDGSAISEVPEPIRWRGDPGWCHRRFNFNLEAGLPHPAWDEFLSRLSQPEVFMAWVFSCFVPNHETRQALWLCGKSGEDGKTKVAGVIGEPFGNALSAISAGQLHSDKRFFLTQFLGKRLAVYSDCMTPNFPQTEVFRNLTGGDAVTMEFKGGGFLHGALKLKVLVASNFEPSMTGANYDRSRMILIDVAPSGTRDDPRWPDRLKAELPAFLGDAQVQFKKLCPNNGKIILPEAINTRLEDFAAEHYELHAAFFSEKFKIDVDASKNDWVRGIDVVKLLERGGEPRVKERCREFKLYLKNIHGIDKVRYAEGFRFKHLVFIDQKTAEHYQKEIC